MKKKIYQMILLAIVFATMATVKVNAQWTGNGSNVYLTDSTKNVGIGTSSPNNKLTVNGGSISVNSNVNSSNKWGAVTASTGTWDIGLKTGKTTAWRMDAPTSGGLYIGYGIAYNAGGWYWISSAKNDMSTGVNYPMRLSCVDAKSANLEVQGRVKCSEVLVAAKWWDDVFKSEYNLRPLEEVKAFIDANKHLPDVTPGLVIETEGLEVGKASSQMIRKIEELTLYMIKQNEDIKNLKSEIEKLKQNNNP